jgi:hypothetical protein
VSNLNRTIGRFKGEGGQERVEDIRETKRRKIIKERKA